MPTIYLKHPRHGTKVATIEAEAVYDEGNGWTRYTLNTPSSVAEEAELEVAESAPDAPKRGRRRKAEETAVPDFLAPQADQGE